MTQREKHLWTLFLLAAGLLTGCSSDDASESPVQGKATESKQEIQLLASGKPFTRATTIDDNTALQGQDLKISAYHHGTETAYLSNATLHYATDAWKFWSGDAETHYYWPAKGSIIGGITYSSLDFVGYCPYTKPDYITSLSYTYSGGITFTADMSSYMTSTAQAGITEFMYAYLEAQTYETQAAASGQALPMQFQHPFAKVYFKLSSASGTAVTVNSITLTDMKTSGTYNSKATPVWSPQGGGATLTISGTGDTPYLVIPNNYGSKTLTVNATWSEWGNEVTANVSANVAFNWAAGTSYTYTLTLSKYALKVETESTYTEQW